MELGIKNKIAFIGGASQGIGKAIGIELAKEGVQPILCSRNKELLNTAKNQIKEITGQSSFCIQADLSVEEVRLAVIEEVLSKFSRVDILITNTGGPPAGKFEDFDHNNWHNAFELLLGSATSMIRGFLPTMKLRKWGRIISITSMAVKQPVDNLILSNSVRGSVVGLMKSLANELGPFNITVNNIMPGYTATERLNKLINSTPSFANAKTEVPLGRFAEPEELAYAVAFLASDKASYITGTSLAVDGGWTKSLF